MQSPEALGAAECAVLGAISASAIHGYELLRLLRERGYEAWAGISLPSVYRIIGRLERAGFIHGRIEGKTRGAPRKRYTITASGRKALSAALHGHLKEPTGARSSFDLAVAHLDLLDPTRTRAAIVERMATLDERYRVMKRRWDEQRPLAWNVEALFVHGELLHQAETAYLRYLLDRLPLG
jgi:DNA-binding PadR family transcriptional regulator